MRVPRRFPGVVVAVVAALALMLPAAGVAGASVTANGAYFPATSSRAVDFELAPLEVDQRTLGFGQQVTRNVVVDGGRPNFPICGQLVLEVRRYQSYRLLWTSGGYSYVVLQRSGLIADYSRPYVGLFLRADGDLVIQTYNRLPNSRTGPGPVVGTPFVAASFGSGGRGVQTMQLRKDGFWLLDRSGQPVRTYERAGNGACTDPRL